MRERLVLSLLCVCLLFCFGSADALTIRRPSFEVLTKKSVHIVRASVTSVRTDIPVGQKGLAFTWTAFRVTKVYKGSMSHNATLKLRLLSVKNGRYRLLASAIPQFKVGQDVILCVRSYAHAASPVLVALHYGVFDLKKSKSGTVAVNNRGGLKVPSALPGFETFLKQTIAKQSPYLKTPPRTRPANTAPKKSSK